MDAAAREQYLVTQVMTAPPQKLQLMLIEGAIRFARQALELWREDRDEEAGDAILRSQEIVTQLLAGLDRERDPELVRKVAGVYLFIFRSLVSAHVRRDEEKLNNALRILESERETWQAVCQQLTETDVSAEKPSAPRHATPPPPATLEGGFDGISEGFTSFEA